MGKTINSRRRNSSSSRGRDDQSERAKSSRKYVLCSDILPTLFPNLGPILCINHKMWTWRGRFLDKRRAVDAFFCGFCGMPRVQVLINSALRLISSHDSPPPPRGGNGGRRRTCLREMCWLKSIEVEDKKII